MNVIFASARDANDQIRLHGLYCLVVVAERYYEYLSEGSPSTYIETSWAVISFFFLFTIIPSHSSSFHPSIQLTVDAIKNQPQAFALQGIEFWTTVAEREKDILLAEEDDYEEDEEGVNI